MHVNEDFFEGLLSRLWPLQEVMLSDTIQFVQCDCIQTRPHKREREQLLQEIRSSILSQVDMMAYSWASYGEVMKGHVKGDDIGRMDVEFVRAFFDCGTVSRSGPRTAKIPPRLQDKDGFTSHFASSRRTSKPRDFILAWMPQFTFYTVPEKAKSMSFSQLFAECFRQILSQTTRIDYPPLLPGRLDTSLGIALPPDFEFTEPDLPKPDVPEPLYLGDLAKLFYGPSLIVKQGVEKRVPVGILRGYSVNVNEITDPSGSDVVRAIEMSKRNARAGWELARIGDPEREIWYPEIPSDELIFDIEDLNPAFAARGEPELLRKRVQFVLSLALHYFTIAPSDSQLDDVAAEIFRMATPRALLRLPAILINGLGITAFKWSKRNVRPVTVHFNSTKYLALVPHTVLDDECEYQYYLVATKETWVYTEGTRFALLAKRKRVVGPGSFVVCLFPPDIRIPRWNFWNRHASKLEKICIDTN